MLFEDKVQKLISEIEFNNVRKTYSQEYEVYDYYFIIVKYVENNEIKELLIDQVNDLDKLKNKKILYKYFINKIHYLNEPLGFYSSDNGEAYHIYNIGYFYIDGYFDQEKDELLKIKELYKKYNNDYSSIVFPFSDEEFLLKNESVILF